MTSNGNSNIVGFKHNCKVLQMGNRSKQLLEYFAGKIHWEVRETFFLLKDGVERMQLSESALTTTLSGHKFLPDETTKQLSTKINNPRPQTQTLVRYTRGKASPSGELLWFEAASFATSSHVRQGRGK